MAEQMIFPNTWEEYEQFYGFDDEEQIYTNGSRLIPAFRVKQWLEHLPSAEIEIIRCKDCKYYREHIPCVGGEYNGCGEWLDEGCEAPVDPDNYCSRAERREEC